MKISTIPVGALRSNSYLVIEEKSKIAFLVDAGDDVQKIYSAIEKEGAIVQYILLTHGHYDHILGAKKLRELTGAKIAIHKEDAICLSDNSASLSDLSDVPFEGFEADLLLKDGQELKIGNMELVVLHTPGHSEGGVCYIVKNERVIFTGDTLFCKTIGRTDFYRANYDKMMLSLYRINALHGNYTVYPGHNIPTTLDKERQSNRYLRKIN